MDRILTGSLTQHISPGGEREVEPLLVDGAEVARLTSLGLRTIRRLDNRRAIPGRVTVGRRVLFRLDVIRQWVAAGLADQDR
jgi:predicted DNA-binding transcriptional regulator AlpA